MEKLVIFEYQFAVGKAEFSTGIVLKNDYSYFLSDVKINELYDVFDTFELAKEYAISLVENNPQIETSIMNSKNEIVFCYDQNGERI